MEELMGIRPLIHSGSDNLESFLAWSAQIKLDMSESNPLLEQVLENIAFSMHPIAGGDSFRMTGHEARELQIRNEGRQLGCLLVQRTKGETQLQVTKWLSATNGWEAWRQLNLSFLSRLLASLLQIGLGDDQPVSCLQPLAWKERVVEHQELSDSSLNMLAIETCQKEQEELGEDNRVDYQANSLQQQQEQDKPDQLVEGGQGRAYKPQPPAYRGKGEPQLPNSAQRACRDKPETKGKGQESHPSFKRELEHRGKSGRQDQKKGKRSLPSKTASSLQMKGEARAASYTRALAQLLLEDRARRPSLLVEHQRPAPKAPTEESLAQPAQKEAASKRQWRPIFC